MRPEPLSTRVFDVTLATLLIAVFSPVLALIGLLIKLGSPGPVLFRQTRIGYGNRPFTVYKFRTMRDGAEHEDGEPQRVEDIESFVFSPPKRDPRVTPLGRVLRTTSLDEWPNFLNVIRGDMRIVGPRPDEPRLVEQYIPIYNVRHFVKPGITGLAQVNGRSNLTYHQMMKYDLHYVKRTSFRMDLAILAKTLLVVAKREGAR